MAYAASITITELGGRDLLVQISETEAAAASEATITGLPTKGLVISQLADLTAGSATTIDPRLTTASGSTLSVQTVVENGTAAATVSNLADPAVPYYSATGTLYHKSVVSGSSDNSVTTVYIIKAGW
tara:strand:+ start:1730 stop:2110 length:381 start_codon:yes stop_codon:yes gene_type:complete